MKRLQPTLYLIGGVNGAGKRVENRVTEGGHAVPKEAVFRRFPRILNLISSLYTPLADEWYLWDASQTPPKFIAEKGNQPIEYYL